MNPKKIAPKFYLLLMTTVSLTLGASSLIARGGGGEHRQEGNFHREGGQGQYHGGEHGGQYHGQGGYHGEYHGGYHEGEYRHNTNVFEGGGGGGYGGNPVYVVPTESDSDALYNSYIQGQGPQQ